MQSGPAKRMDLETVRSEVLQDSRLLRLLDYWRDLRRGRLMPGRSDIDPIDIPWALPCVYLIDYKPSTQRFQYRLAGDDICRNFDRISLRGLELAEIMAPETAAYVRQRWLAMIDPPSIMAMHGLIYFAMERVSTGERLMMPLSDSGDARVTGLFGITVSEWSRVEPVERVSAQVNYIPVADIP